MTTSAQNFSCSLDSLLSSREQVRLELHLLSMEARRQWDEYETQILAFEDLAGGAVHELAQHSVEAAKRLTDSVNEFATLHLRNVHRNERHDRESERDKPSQHDSLSGEEAAPPSTLKRLLDVKDRLLQAASTIRHPSTGGTTR